MFIWDNSPGSTSPKWFATVTLVHQIRTIGTPFNEEPWLMTCARSCHVKHLWIRSTGLKQTRPHHNRRSTFDLLADGAEPSDNKILEFRMRLEVAFHLLPHAATSSNKRGCWAQRHSEARTKNQGLKSNMCLIFCQGQKKLDTNPNRLSGAFELIRQIFKSRDPLFLCDDPFWWKSFHPLLVIFLFLARKVSLGIF